MSEELNQFKKDELKRLRRPLTLEEAAAYADEVLGPKEKELTQLRSQLAEAEKEHDNFAQNLNKYVRKGEHSIFETLDNLEVQLAASEANQRTLEGLLETANKRALELVKDNAASEAMCERLKAHLKIMDDDLLENLPEYERLEGTTDLLSESPSDALAKWGVSWEKVEKVKEALEAAKDWLNRFGEHAPIQFGGEHELSDKLSEALTKLRNKE